MDAAARNIPACYLLGSIFASALYSLYVLAFGASIHFLSNVRGRRVKPNKIILAGSVILFICVSVVCQAVFMVELALIFSQHWCMGIAYIYTAFVVHGDTANGALAFFGGLPITEVARFYVYGMTIALLDSVLVRYSFKNAGTCLRSHRCTACTSYGVVAGRW
jgi:hypothetical protein